MYYTAAGYGKLIGTSLSERHYNIENSMVVHAKNCGDCNTLRTTVWYGGSCTNKHDKLTDTSIQVLSNTKIFNFIY